MGVPSGFWIGDGLIGRTLRQSAGKNFAVGETKRSREGMKWAMLTDGRESSPIQAPVRNCNCRRDFVSSSCPSARPEFSTCLLGAAPQTESAMGNGGFVSAACDSSRASKGPLNPSPYLLLISSHLAQNSPCGPKPPSVRICASVVLVCRRDGDDLAWTACTVESLSRQFARRSHKLARYSQWQFHQAYSLNKQRGERRNPFPLYRALTHDPCR
jgi:hypothetical protein